MAASFHSRRVLGAVSISRHDFEHHSADQRSKSKGMNDLAALLKRHLVQSSETFLLPNSSNALIYKALGDLDMTYMADVEDRIMARFNELFEFYLGPVCYSSFVVMMDGARRRLFRDEWTRPEDFLHPVSHFDAVFGPANRRSMDVISLRAEVFNRRGMHAETEVEAALLIERAEMINDDPWQRFYNLTRGSFLLGVSQYALKKRDAAIGNLLNVFRYEEDLQRVNDFHMFGPEKFTALKCLEEMMTPEWILNGGCDADDKL